MTTARRCMLAIAGVGMVCAGSAALAGGGAPARATAKSVAAAAPVRFEANVGQTDASVRYVARGAGYGMFLKANELTLALRSARTSRDRVATHLPGAKPFAAGQTAVVRMTLAGANGAATASAMGSRAGTSRYVRRSGILDAPSYAGVAFGSVYPGIDLAYYGKGRSIEHDFVVRPGADPRRIAMDITGATGVSVSDGNLVLKSAAGVLTWNRPYAYQVVNGRRVGVPAAYSVARKSDGSARVAFDVARYDTGRTLVIDPVLAFSTFQGGTDEDDAWGVSVDNSGNSVIAGQTFSADYPASGSPSGTSDAFITKLNAAGTAQIWSMYVGGNGDDAAYGVAVDAVGDVYVGGATSSANFPTTGGSAQPLAAGGVDGFAMKVSSAGAVVYATRVGGSADDMVFGVDVNSAGEMALAGQTASANLPVVGALQPTFQGGYDAFIGKLNAAGSAYSWLTYYAGIGSDAASGVKFDTAGHVYAVGGTNSNGFPATGGSFGSTVKGGLDVFVAKITGAGNALVYGGRTGGSADDYAMGLAVEPTGAVYVVGYTASTNFFIASGAPISVAPAGLNGFVIKVSASGAQLPGSTYLGGNGNDIAYAVGLLNNAPMVVGSTTSTNFPTTAGALAAANAGGYDAFVTNVAANIKSFTYSSYLGGSGDDFGTAVAVKGAVGYVAGAADSANYPVTAGAAQTVMAGNWDAVLTALNYTVATKLVVNSVSGSVGATKSHIAYLNVLVGGAPVVGRLVAFKVDGSPIGTSNPTTSGGVAVLSWTIPPMATGPHPIQGDFAGDLLYGPSTGTGTLLVL